MEKNFEEKREAYEAAFAALMDLIDNPVKSVPFAEYSRMLKMAAKARDKAYEEMWAAARGDQ